jgi:hypothetical protein
LNGDSLHCFSRGLCFLGQVNRMRANQTKVKRASRGGADDTEKGKKQVCFFLIIFRGIFFMVSSGLREAVIADSLIYYF